jgi:hypothetical protein
LVTLITKEHDFSSTSQNYIKPSLILGFTGTNK